MNSRTWMSIGLVAASTSVAFGFANASMVKTRQAPVTLRALYGLRTPTQLNSGRTALVLVDFQDEYFHGRLPLPEGASAVAHAAALASWARASGILIVHVRNVVTRPGSPIFAAGSDTTQIVPQLQPQAEDLVLDKSMAGAFSRTDLDARLHARGVDTLILGGLMTHLAVSTTASDGTVLGYRVIVASDATATRDLPGPAGYAGVDASTLHRVALAIMADRVADVLPAASIMKLPIEH